MEALRRAMVLLGVVGALVFGAAFATSIADPGFVESIGRELIRRQVEVRVGAAVAAIDESFILQRARRMAKVESEDAAQLRRIAERLPDHVKRISEEMRDPACPCRLLVLMAADPRLQVESRASGAARAAGRLDAMIRTRYMETARQLQREFRIFTGTTASVFGLLVAAALLRPKANLHLVPAALILLATTGVAAYFYLFRQDWLHTIVFSDYVGLGFVAWLGAAFLSLCDILFNRGRIVVALLAAVTAPIAAC